MTLNHRKAGETKTKASSFTRIDQAGQGRERRRTGRKRARGRATFRLSRRFLR